MLGHAARDVRLFSSALLAHSWSVRLTLNSLKEIKLARIQMHISSKTHSASGPRRSEQEAAGTVVKEILSRINQLRRGKGKQRGRVGGTGWGKDKQVLALLYEFS